MSDLRIYPFEIAVSAFVLRSPYLKVWVIFCDEASLGKRYEVMLLCQNAARYVTKRKDKTIWRMVGNECTEEDYHRTEE